MISVLKGIYSLKNSNKIAIILCDNEKILETKSYGDVAGDSEKFIKFFLPLLKPDVNVCLGLFMEKNVYLPSIILSLQKLKHAFVHLSNNYTVNTLNLKYILSLHLPSISSFDKIGEILIDEYKFILWRSLSNYTTSLTFGNIFCLVQSSGTTGAHKTIRIPHNCIQKNAVSLKNVFKINSDDVIFWGTPLSFDPSLIELLLALLSRATLVITPYNTYINPLALWYALFKVVPITVLQIVPSVFNRWSEDFIKKLLCNTKLKVLALGGEDFPKNVLKFQRNDDLRVFNLYGVTEVSCWATAHQISNESVYDEIPIGECLEEIIIEVRNNGGVITNGEGEIYIGSNAGNCYINEETESSVLTLRETGDLCYVNNGNIYYKGRKNGIIKRYGHRINLQNIEKTVFKECQLTNKCIWSENNKKLSIFILIKDFDINLKNKTLDKLKSKLLQILSPENFPDCLEILQSFPTTSHGKIDERKLEEYLITPPNREIEPTEVFCNLWCKYLGINSNFDNCNFIEMGGNSINILQLLTEFQEITKVEYPDLITAIFEKKFSDCKTIIVNNHGKCISTRTDEVVSRIKKQKLDVEGIRILWRYDLKACVDSSPLVFIDSSESIRIAAGSFCNILAILSDTGEEVFKDLLTGSIECTPTVSPCKKLVYIGCYDGTMHCINYDQKKTVWTFKTGDRIKSSVIFLKDCIRIVFGSYDRFLYCLTSQDGSIVWKTTLDGSISADIIFDQKFGIFVTTTHGTCYCLSEHGDITWSFDCKAPIFGKPCIFTLEELIIIPSVVGILFCLEVKSGGIVWTFKSDGHIFSSIVKYEDNIIFGCHDKNIYILKVSTNNFILIGKILLSSEISSTPYVYHKNNSVRILAASNNGTIYLINFEQLSVIQKLELPGEVFSSPVVNNDKIFVGCRDNYLYCLSIEK